MGFLYLSLTKSENTQFPVACGVPLSLTKSENTQFPVACGVPLSLTKSENTQFPVACGVPLSLILPSIWRIRFFTVNFFSRFVRVVRGEYVILMRSSL